MPATAETRQAGTPGDRTTFAEIAALVAVLAVTLLVYRESFLGFFIRDDFDWIVLSRSANLIEHARSFFRFNQWGTYRPLGHETFFWLGQKIFGLRPLGFHLVSFTTHLAASVLLYFTLRRFSGVFASLTGTLFYAVHSAQLISVYWISALPEPLAMVFHLSALLLFIRFDREDDRRAYACSVIAMGLGIMSKESVLVLPLILACYSLLFARARLMWTTPYFAISGLYTLLRIFSKSVQLSPYALSLGNETWQALLAYLSWMTGLSESVMRSGPHWDLSLSYRIMALIFACIAALLVWLSRNRRAAVFAILWMGFSLQPVLYFSRHNFAYYLAPALAGFSLMIASALRPPGSIGDWRRWVPALGIASVTIFLSCAAAGTEGRWWLRQSFLRRDLVGQLQFIDRAMPAGATAYIVGFESSHFDAAENGALFKTYNLPVIRFKFVLPGLDPDLRSTLQGLKQPDSLRQAYCFVLSDGKVADESPSFRNDPDRFLVDQPVRYHAVPGVELVVTPDIIRSGRDTLTIRMINFEVPAIDLLYSIDDQVMPPVIRWLLDAEQTATVFVDTTTPKGRYHFMAVRDSRRPGDDNWIKVEAFATVR